MPSVQLVMSDAASLPPAMQFRACCIARTSFVSPKRQMAVDVLSGEFKHPAIVAASAPRKGETQFTTMFCESPGLMQAVTARAFFISGDSESKQRVGSCSPLGV